MAAVLRNLPSDIGLSEDEKVLWARYLAATPDERWRLNRAALRSVGSYLRSAKKKFPS